MTASKFVPDNMLKQYPSLNLRRKLESKLPIGLSMHMCANRTESDAQWYEWKHRNDATDAATCNLVPEFYLKDDNLGTVTGKLKFSRSFAEAFTIGFAVKKTLGKICK